MSFKIMNLLVIGAIVIVGIVNSASVDTAPAIETDFITTKTAHIQHIVQIEDTAEEEDALSNESSLTSDTIFEAYLITLFLGAKKKASWLNQTLLEEELRTLLPGDDGKVVGVVNVTEEHSGLTILLQLYSNESCTFLITTIDDNRTAISSTEVLMYSVGAALGVLSWEEMFGYEGDPKAGLIISIVVPIIGLVMIAIIIAVMIVLAVQHRKKKSDNNDKLVELDTGNVTTTTTSGGIASGTSANQGITGSVTLVEEVPSSFNNTSQPQTPTSVSPVVGNTTPTTPASPAI